MRRSSSPSEDDMDHTYKVTEIVGSSPDGVDAAVRNGLERASSTLRNLSWFEVTDIRGAFEHGARGLVPGDDEGGLPPRRRLRCGRPGAALLRCGAHDRPRALPRLPDAGVRRDDLRRDVGARGRDRPRSTSARASPTPTARARSPTPRWRPSAPGTTSIRRAPGSPSCAARSSTTSSTGTGSSSIPTPRCW